MNKELIQEVFDGKRKNYNNFLFGDIKHKAMGLIPGSYNPLHAGHLNMAWWVENVY